MLKKKYRAWSQDEGMISPDYVTRDGVAWWKSNSIPTCSDIVMQYLGMEDKHGIEVFERDIIKVTDIEDGYSCDQCGSYHESFTTTKIYEVTWENFHWALFGNSKNIEVIGNAYENPDLEVVNV